MVNSEIFQRYELKFILTLEQYHLIKKAMEPYMCQDQYGETNICNLYCDTSNFRLVRRSNEKPFYKEKLRIRSYGVLKEDMPVFIEIKKKFDSIVYKRRIEGNEKDIYKILTGDTPNTSQIGQEISYFTKLYKGIKPQMFISYHREAFYGIKDKDFRITFDKSILWRNCDLSLRSGIYGEYVLPEDKILMEIKTSSTIPLWLIKFLSKNKIYKTSFSKYGTAYTKMLLTKA